MWTNQGYGYELQLMRLIIINKTVIIKYVGNMKVEDVNNADFFIFIATRAYTQQANTM